MCMGIDSDELPQSVDFLCSAPGLSNEAGEIGSEHRKCVMYQTAPFNYDDRLLGLT